MFIEKLKTLSNAVKDEPDDVKLMEDTVNDCASYVKAVVRLELVKQMARFKQDPEANRKEMEQLDKNRSYAHNSCIANLKIINRLAKISNFDDIFTGIDDMDRVAIADEFIITIAAEYIRRNVLQQNTEKVKIITFKDKIEALLVVEKIDINFIEYIEGMLNCFNDYVYDITIAIPSDIMPYKDSLKYLISINHRATKHNMPILFPDLETMTQTEIIHKYIKAIISDYFKNRIK